METDLLLALRRGEPAPAAPTSGGLVGSAVQLDSQYGPIVNLLTRDQSVLWFFQTRDGSKGVLQIVGFTNDPRAVKIRYKLVRNSANPAAEPAAISEAVLAEPPRLRFLAWQDEWMHDEWKKDQP